MNTRFSVRSRFYCTLCFIALNAALRVKAQITPSLDLQLYAGLSIAGKIGTVYSVEYASNLSQTNDWRCLNYLQLPTTHYLWFDPGSASAGNRFYRAVVFAAPTNLVFVPPGTFVMGSQITEEDREPFAPAIVEGPQTVVTISQGFWMGKYEVTQGEYLALMGSNPSHFNGDRTGEPPPFNQYYGTDLTRPVEQVTWFNATNYCGKLTKRERTAGRISANSVYRLPTSAEWEYACRAWTSTRFSYGDDPGYSNLTNYAWYGAFDSSGLTHPVGQKLPNRWGLYDMLGNVVEWCLDWYGPYSGGIEVDPKGPASGTARVTRGGLWFRPADFCRSAWRNALAPDFVGGVGFRVVLAPSEH